jgi:AcrR family transcriptional regulator
MSSENLSTRHRILAAALSLLEAGKEASMADIAKAAGISRQAVYLHFPSRADLLIAATRYLDELKDSDERLKASRSARTGLARLDAFIEAWGNYIPEVYGVGKALLAIYERDAAAAAAWDGRMAAMREGCQAAVDALTRDGRLRADLTPPVATDMLWAMLSVRMWELLTKDCGWSHADYVDRMKLMARRMLTVEQD